MKRNIYYKSACNMGELADESINIEENAFNSYVMTLSQKWYKLGNIHASIGFLIEKPKDKEE